MAAILRSGKFLRMVTGLTRSGQNQQQGSSTQDQGAPLLTPINTNSVQFHALSMQQLQNALPILSTDQDKKHENQHQYLERRGSDPLLDFYVDKQKIDEAAKSIKILDNNHVGLNVVKEIKHETEEPATRRASKSLKREKSLRVKNETKRQEQAVHEEAKPKSAPEPVLNNVPIVQTPENNVPLTQEIVTGNDQIPINAELENTAAVQLVPLCEDPASHQWYPLPVVCQMFRAQGRLYDLEALVWGSQGIRPEDRKCIYYWTLQSYMDHGMFPQAVDLTRRLEVEGLAADFPEYHTLMDNFAMLTYQQQQMQVAWTESEVSSIQNDSPTPAPSVTTTIEDYNSNPYYYRKLKKAIANKDTESCLACYKALEKNGGKDLNVTESSTLIELFVKGDHIEEAITVTERMLAREAYPLPRIFRFLLNRLASHGHIEAMSRIGSYLTPKIKKEVSFDNRLCNGYLAANRAEDYLWKLIYELDEALNSGERISEEKLQVLKDKFPRGGAMGLLEANPNLVEPYTKLALKFVDLGYVAPVNVLWTYHFINGRHDLAKPLWDRFVRTCPQIMFQKVCQTARSTANIDLAQRLVGLLENAVVTNGARGIAYSCLLDVLTQNKEYDKGLSALHEGLDSGIRLEDVNRTALKRLKDGLENQGDDFPFEIPHKSVGSSVASIMNEDDAGSIRSMTPILN